MTTHYHAKLGAMMKTKRSSLCTFKEYALSFNNGIGNDFASVSDVRFQNRAILGKESSLVLLVI